MSYEPLICKPGDLPDAEALYTRLRDALAAELAGLPAERTHLVGILSGGAWLAQRLHADLGLPGTPGVLNISHYRDDFDRIGLHPQIQPTDIPFPVADQHLIVLDDVLYTGRTIRAAMNELFDYGRPASISLAVLVDRGGRELPIAARVAAARVEPAPQASLVLARDDAGRFSFTLEQESSNG